ncbi:TRAPP II complex [Auriculariales sp. MPI-PUGE-AT-0066]|nr:TRAPP II complex [Auriculariales sp. MPI-PUGE-AT-0066]
MTSNLTAFASLGHVRVLLLPVGGISKSKFESYANLVREIDHVRLVDIPADPREDKARFMPAPLASGSIQLAYVTRPPPVSHAPLAVFRPSAFPLGVIGIGSLPSRYPPEAFVTQLNTDIARGFPPELAPFPLARNVFIFEESEDGDAEAPIPAQGSVIIPAVMGNKKLYLGQLLSDLCSNIVGEFTGLTRLLESPHSMDALAAQALPPFPSEHAPASFPPRISLQISESPRQSMDVSSDARRTSSSFVRPRTTSIPHSSSARELGKAAPPLPPTLQRSATQTSATLKQARRHTANLLPNGRLYKVLGDLYLLAGQLNEAAVWYTTAQNMFKNAQDMVWHASVLEGLCTVAVLESYNALETHVEVSPTGERETWEDINEKMGLAISLYAKASPSSMPTDGEYNLFAVLLCDAALRHASVLFALWLGKGWNATSLTYMVRPTLPPIFATRPISEAHLVGLDAGFKVTRSQISAILTSAHGPFLVHLRPHEKLRILSTLASTYANLGYQRKEVYILRELLSVLMDMIVCGREEMIGSAVSPLASPKINGAGPLNGSASPILERGSVALRAHESADGNESILSLIRHVCDVYGVPLDGINIYEDADELQPSSSADTPQKEHFGWPELQVGVIREAMAISQALPDHVSAAQFAFSALKALQSALSADDHRYLFSTAVNALGTAKRRGDERKLEYWAENPIVSVEVPPLPFERLPIQHSTRDLLPPVEEEAAAVGVGRRDPFIYNPRLSKTSALQVVAPQGEPLEFIITLHNPYTFDVEVQGLSLSANGVNFDSQPVAVFMPAGSLQTARIVVTPPEPGLVMIRGCVARVPGSIRKEFLLPFLTQEEEDKRAKRHSMAILELGRCKRMGLHARGVRSSGDSSAPSLPAPSRFLECRIVPAPPLVKIRRTSLTRNALTLYSGESSVIRLTLENVSKIDVDFVKVTFDDSTIGPAQAALAEGELSVFDTYETEFDLIHRPIFTWSMSETQQTIGAARRTAVTVNCYGKIGCTSGTIQVSYGQTRPALEAGDDVFYVRQVLYPVLVTVYHTLECTGMDIVPFGTLDVHGQSAADDPNFRLLTDAAAGADDEEWCLFTVDVRNAYGQPFDVFFDRRQEDTEDKTVTYTVPPGSTTRILLPLKRAHLPDSITSQPIPTLSNRQFIVAKEKLTGTEAATRLELYWYREELFKFVNARWKETNHPRFGELSLRQQRLSMRMLNAFKTPTVRVRLSLVSETGQPLPQRLRRKQSCKLNQFVSLRMQVQNLSSAPLVLALSLALTPVDYVLVEGVLTDIPVGRVQSGETTTLDMGMCFVAAGSFDIAAEARSLVENGFQQVGTGEFVVLVESDNKEGS